MGISSQDINLLHPFISMKRHFTTASSGGQRLPVFKNFAKWRQWGQSEEHVPRASLNGREMSPHCPGPCRQSSGVRVGIVCEVNHRCRSLYHSSLARIFVIKITRVAATPREGCFFFLPILLAVNIRVNYGLFVF